jgi:hypothetical protein
VATDATGTPTALGIPKFNTSVDAPSGLGFNAAMDSIDALIAARIIKPSAPTADDALVWNGTSWVAAKLGNAHVAAGANLAVSKLAAGTEGQVLKTTGGVPTWGAAASGGAVTLIEEKSVSVATPTLDFTSIPGTYKHLRLIATFKMASSQQPQLRFNGDTAANYSYGHLYTNGAVAPTSAASSSTSLIPITVASADWIQIGLDIPYYADTTVHKGIHGTVYAHGVMFGGLMGGRWNQTTAVNAINIFNGGSANFIVGSRFALYGVS